ncbi:hypothetical protein M885DRAFT_517306 [Pelagophyceae sp. CCMP2097]|nr:hypothetical protein M885DRAFT_517306 [Pelagophyceae sp. CCMP2097]
MCDVVDDAMDAAAALIVPGADRTIVRGGKAPDIFERAEHPDVASLPLLSQVARRGPKAMPMVSKDARESTSQANVFKGRLHAMARLARDDAVLARVTLCNEGIDDDWAAALADALGFNSRLEQLVAVGNFITDVGGVRLAHAAALHPALQALCLGGNALGDETAVAAAETLQKCTTLQCLNLSAQKHHRNHLVGHVRTHRRDELDKAYKRGGIANKLSLKERLGRAGSMVVEYVPPAALEGAPKTLVARDAAPARATVRLEGDAAAATTLLAAARAAPSSRGDMLTLRGADILTLRDGGGDDGDVSSAESDASDSDSASGAFSVSAFEAKTWGRRPLGCEFCGAITSRGIEALAAQLPKCNLTELDLSGQRAKNAGALSIAQAIETGSRIVFLALDSNGIGDAGVSALATAFLAPLSRMRVLSLRQNRATDVAALAISDLLPHATHTATSLDLSMNAIGKEGCFALAESSECGAVVHINVSANPGAEFRRDKSRLELLRQMRASSSFSKRGGVSRPIRLCTAQADSGRNLLHLRKSAGEGPGGPTDSLLRDMQRAATARSNREARGRMPAQLDRKAKKLAKHSQKAYEAKAHLPPLSFAATQSAMVRHAAAARDAPHGARDTLSASRVGRFVAKEFGGVASVKGALHGRLDLAARKPKVPR